MMSVVCDSVLIQMILSDCLHDKTKTAEIKITKLESVTIPRQPMNIGSKVKGQGHWVKNWKYILTAIISKRTKKLLQTCHRDSPA